MFDARQDLLEGETSHLLQSLAPVVLGVLRRAPSKPHLEIETFHQLSPHPLPHFHFLSPVAGKRDLVSVLPLAPLVEHVVERDVVPLDGKATEADGTLAALVREPRALPQFEEEPLPFVGIPLFSCVRFRLPRLLPRGPPYLRLGHPLNIAALLPRWSQKPLPKPAVQEPTCRVPHVDEALARMVLDVGRPFGVLHQERGCAQQAARFRVVLHRQPPPWHSFDFLVQAIWQILRLCAIHALLFLHHGLLRLQIPVLEPDLHDVVPKQFLLLVHERPDVLPHGKCLLLFEAINIGAAFDALVFGHEVSQRHDAIPTLGYIGHVHLEVVVANWDLRSKLLEIAPQPRW
mmetsp:Transcript_102042/g.327429  ORF Transcript_102042/g.327429 Transcript_102042/m.327429 type:complete len:346 (-) Transcript_102042:355-1392(-)